MALIDRERSDVNILIVSLPLSRAVAGGVSNRGTELLWHHDWDSKGCSTGRHGPQGVRSGRKI